jgi:hypothetical protein
MPSLRKPLSTRQKIIALYTDPALYVLADCVAQKGHGIAPGTDEYRRHVTNFALDVEARLHTNRQKTQSNTEDAEMWNLRRDLAWRTTGEDTLLSEPPTEQVNRRWRTRWVPTSDVGGKALPGQLAAFIDQYERVYMVLAQQLGQFPVDEERDLVNLDHRHVCSGDGTYVRAWSQVKEVPDPISEDGGSIFLGAGNRAARREGGIVKHTKVQEHVHRVPKANRETNGVNHVAILTRTRHGRLILTVERALGGEVHAALRGIDRIAPLASGAIRGLVYDKALSGWQIDYLLARHGMVSVVAPAARNETPDDYQVAADLVEEILADRRAAAEQCAITTGKKPKLPKAPGKSIKVEVASRVLGDLLHVDRLIADAEAGRPLGEGLRLGTSTYLDSHNVVVPVDSTHQRFMTIRHDVGEESCAHELHVDDGALWDTRSERGLRVKDQRLACLKASTTVSKHTKWHELRTTYEFVCRRSGELLTVPVDNVVSGEWAAGKTLPARTARQNMMLVARCDAAWRKIYGLRNDCESWFSWLKQQLLDDKRAPSLDLNHQLLDVLYAGIITNAITLFHARREGGI